jgi:hypothetical protein
MHLTVQRTGADREMVEPEKSCLTATASRERYTVLEYVPSTGFHSGNGYHPFVRQEGAMYPAGGRPVQVVPLHLY